MAEYRIDVVVDPRRAQAGTRAVEESLRRTENQAFRLRDTLLKALGGVAVAAALSASAQQALALGDSLAEVSTLVDTSVVDMRALKAGVLDLSAAYNGVPTRETKALYQIISAGATDAARALEILDASNRLAVGGVTDVAIAADGLTSVLNAYGNRIRSVVDVSDAMFVAMRAGKTTIGELSTEIGKVAPLAAAAGVTLDELFGSISAITKGGIATAQAATGVRAILVAVTKQEEAAVEAAKRFGIEFSTAAIKSMGFIGFLEHVIEKTGGSEQKIAQLFREVEAMTTMLALAGEAGKSFAQIMDQMANKTGETERAFQKIAGSPGFQLRRFFGALRIEALQAADAMIVGVAPAMSFLARHVDQVIGLVKALAIVLAVTYLVPALGLVRSTLNLVAAGLFRLTQLLLRGELVAYLSNVRGAALATAVAVRRLIVQLYALAAAALSNPFTAFLTILSAVLVLVVLFRKRIGEAFKSWAEGISLGIPRLGTLYDFIVAWGRNLWLYFQGVVRIITSYFRALYDYVVSILKQWVTSFNEAFDWIARKSLQLFGIDLNNDLAGFLLRSALAVDAFVSAWIGAFHVIEAGLKAVLERDLGELVEMVSNTGEWAGEKFAEGFNAGMTARLATRFVEKTLTDAAALFRSRTATPPGTPEPPTPPGPPGGDEKLAAESDEWLKTWRQYLKSLDDEIVLLQLDNREREIRRGLIEAENTLGLELVDTQGNLLTADAELFDAKLRLIQNLREESEMLESLVSPQQRIADQVALLNRLYGEGRVTLEQYTKKLRELKIEALEMGSDALSGLARGALSVEDEFTNMSRVVEYAVTNTFRGMEDALAEFVSTGKADFASLVDSILKDIARIAVRSAITGPLASRFGGSFGNLGAAAAIEGPPAPITLPGGWTQLKGFQKGGSFFVPGAGGRDSRIVAFRATPGEHVSVSEDGHEGRGDTFVFNVTTPDSAGFGRSVKQEAARTAGVIDRARRRRS